MINVAFGLDNNFVRHCAAAIASILCNSKADITFYIIGDLDDANKSKLKELENIRPFEIVFIDIDGQEFDNLPVISGITKAMYYRLLIPRLLPQNEHKVIYLDCDLIVTGDISELYDTDLGEFYGAVVESCDSKQYAKNLDMPDDAKYFNSGVILFNLQALREINFLKECMSSYEKIKNKIRFPDQDILNTVFYKHAKYLPARWNLLSGYIRKEHTHSSITAETARDEIKKVKIIHYNGVKPWNKYSLHKFKEQYFVYAGLTPWKDELPSKVYRTFISFTYLMYKFFIYFLRHPLFFLRIKFWRKLFRYGFSNTIG